MQRVTEVTRYLYEKNRHINKAGLPARLAQDNYTINKTQTARMPRSFHFRTNSSLSSLSSSAMKKQKQQTISRFFSSAPKPKHPPPPSPSPPPPPPPPSPKITATVSFSPTSTATKRALSKTITPTPPPAKKPRHPPPVTATAPLCRRTLTPKHTPLEQQVVELKSRYPDVLLMVEVGYRYRFFGEDAEVAARVLGIIAHQDHSFLTASVPTFRLSFHARRLVGAGYKVGVVKQTETAAIKAHGENRVGPFSRGLSALYTRATIEAAEDLGGGGEEGVGGPCSGNYLLCVVEKGLDVGSREGGVAGSFDVKIGIVAVEVSTGDVIYGEFNDNVMRSGLEAVVLSLSPTEILLGKPLSFATEKLLLSYAGPTSGIRVEYISRDCFNDGGALAEVISIYENTIDDIPMLDYSVKAQQTPQDGKCMGIEGIMTMPELAIQALALTTRYLKQFGFERILCLGASFRPYSANSELTLSPNALQQLEITKNKTDGSLEGSLLQVMNHTCTSSGSRLLRHWVTHPLCDKLSISARLDAVSEIAESMGSCRALTQAVELDEDPLCGAYSQLEISHLLSSVLRTLGRKPDIQRGIARIFHQTATPTEVINVIQAILHAGKQLQKLYLEDDANDEEPLRKTIQSTLLRRLILTASSSIVIAIAAKLLSCLNKDAADRKDMLNLFNDSCSDFPEVTGRRNDILIVEKKLDLLIFNYRKKLRLHNLKFISVSGTTHLIELPSDVWVPSDWVMVNSTKKTIRYHPPEVIEALDELSLAKEELAIACKSAWKCFLMDFGRYYSQFQAVVQALAALDCLLSLAILSRNKNYVRPLFVDDEEPSQIEILAGRHPVLESILRDNFVPNDTNLHAFGEYCQIVTGPNMGGKSSYIRQVALIAIMAQVGSFVPASSAKLHVLDGIYTRIGVSDSIEPGRSTFFEELSEASDILHQCSRRSLVIMDELGRGTSTHDGVAIAYASLHYLLEQKKSMVLFVTHYPKIMEIPHKNVGSVGAYHVSYLASQNPLAIAASECDSSVGNLDQSEITFLYKVVPGISDKSFGLNVARLAQLPSSCTARAAVMAAKLETEINTRTRDHLLQKEAIEINKVGIQNDAAQSGIFDHYYDYFGEFATSFKKWLLLVRSTLNDSNPSDILCCLKDAKGFALDMINKELVIT